MIGKTNVNGNNQGSSGNITENDFTYTGSYLFNSDENNFELALLTSGTLSFRKTPGLVSAFIVGGGKSGGSGSGDATGGDGGDGGECLTESVTLTADTNYPVTIGKSNQDTTGFGFTARTGEGSSGGKGSIVTGLNRDRAASAGDDGVYAFDRETSLIPSLSGRKYGPGGGGGDSFNSSYVYANSTDHGGSNDGGETGAGIGGVPGQNSNRDATSGAANTGSGGGGAWERYNSSGSPGTGGSGIIIIRGIMSGDSGGGDSGEDDYSSYTSLTNKPLINSVELVGDKTSAQLGLADAAEVENIRIGVDGTVYESAGAAVRAQIKKAMKSGSGGTPIIARASEDMIDTAAIYVYVGSETGYTYGDWYYYDGTTWVDAGQYAIGLPATVIVDENGIMKFL